jgi:hypothetical protein
MQININEPVWVKLTKEGEETYRKNFQGLGMDPIPLKKDAG